MYAFYVCAPLKIIVKKEHKSKIVPLFYVIATIVEYLLVLITVRHNYSISELP